MHRTERPAGAPGDPGILAFRIDADHRSIGGQQIGYDGADTFAGTCRCHREPKRQAATALKRHRARRESIAEQVSAVLPVMRAMDPVETDLDDLTLLETENRRLKQLLAEYLGQQNAQLKTMLKRFETT